MPIKVMWRENGPFAICDSAEEAAELLKLGANGLQAKTMPSKSSLLIPEDEGETVKRVFSEINENAKTILRALAKHPHGVKGDDLSAETGFSSDKFGGILGGASKAAKRHHLELDTFLLSEIRLNGSNKYRFLKPQPLLLKYAAELEPKRFPR